MSADQPHPDPVIEASRLVLSTIEPLTACFAAGLPINDDLRAIFEAFIVSAATALAAADGTGPRAVLRATIEKFEGDDDERWHALHEQLAEHGRRILAGMEQLPPEQRAILERYWKDADQ